MQFLEDSIRIPELRDGDLIVCQLLSWHSQPAFAAYINNTKKPLIVPGMNTLPAAVFLDFP